MVEERPEGVHVAPRVELLDLASRLFGRHVRRGADRHPAQRDALVRDDGPREAEVSEPRPPRAAGLVDDGGEGLQLGGSDVAERHEEGAEGRGGLLCGAQPYGLGEPRLRDEAPRDGELHDGVVDRVEDHASEFNTDRARM